MTERDAKILEHIGIYTLSVRKVIEHAFFDGKDCDNVISRLLDKGCIQANGGSESKEASLPGGISYYQLTKREVGNRGLPAHYASPKGPEALHRDISVLWACVMSPRRRRRLLRKELTGLFGNNDNVGGRGFGIPHAIELDGERSAVLRMYTPMTIDDAALVRTLRSDAERAARHPTVGGWVGQSTYRFLVLVDSDHRRQRLLEELAKDSTFPLVCSVEIAPSIETLHFACSKRGTAK